MSWLPRRSFALALTLAAAGCAQEQDASAPPSQDAGSADAPDASEASDSSQDGGVILVRSDLGDEPLPQLPDDWRMRFNVGDGLFDQTFFEAQGLGPVFIRAACSSCHANDARGPGAVRKMVMMGTDGSPAADQSELPYGHTVRPQTIKGVDLGVEAPKDNPAVFITIRMPPAVYGRGYLEAILDSEIQRVEAEQDQRSDGVSGRINWVIYGSKPNTDVRFHEHALGEQLIGRFGLKARVATMDDFTADALQGDMGLTTEMRPDEVPQPKGLEDKRPGIDTSTDTLNLLADYMRMLRIPPRTKADADVQGAKLFEETQCSACHVPTLHTDPNYALPLLADIDAPVYTDILLHEMGAGFSDGLRDFDAGSSEWRTAPLLGLRFLRNYLHDGRASTIEEAIVMHGADDSEAAESVQRFQALDEESRTRLLSFVSAL